MTINLPFAASAVGDRIDEALGAWKVGPGDLAICAGATEGEVMFAEKCLVRGAQVRLLILEPVSGRKRRRSHRAPARFVGQPQPERAARGLAGQPRAPKRRDCPALT